MNARQPERSPEYENVRPLHDKILLQYLTDEYETPAGLIVNCANIEEEKVRRARVVSVGPGPQAQNTGLKRDDVVFVGRARGHELPVPANCQPYVIVDAKWGVKQWIGAKDERNQAEAS